MLLHSSSWILIDIQNIILTNVVDINLKCSGYKFCPLEIYLAGFQYVFHLCHPYKSLISNMDIVSFKDVLSFCNCTIAMAFHFSHIVAFFIVIVSLSQESCFGTVENSKHTKYSYFV